MSYILKVYKGWGIIPTHWYYGSFKEANEIYKQEKAFCAMYKLTKRKGIEGEVAHDVEEVIKE